MIAEFGDSVFGFDTDHEVAVVMHGIRAVAAVEEVLVRELFGERHGLAAIKPERFCLKPGTFGTSLWDASCTRGSAAENETAC